MIFVLEILGLSGNLEEVESDTSYAHILWEGRDEDIIFLKLDIYNTDLVDLHESLPGFEV